MSLNEELNLQIKGYTVNQENIIMNDILTYILVTLLNFKNKEKKFRHFG